ncbi:MAG TPA: helix-hairpin-helix domain-containing protein [bacterium]|nr:helix-hairpin-helix domain-containing protein [bacterium]
MKKIYIFISFLILIFQALNISAQTKLDINNATLKEIQALKIFTTKQSEEIYNFILEKGGLQNIYELSAIPNIDAKLINELKDKITIYPKKTDAAEYSYNVMQTIKNLIDEENLPINIVDYLEDLAVNPLNINKADFNDLAMIPNLPPQDIAAVLRHIKKNGEIKSMRQLSGARDLSSFGYRTLKNYITFSDQIRAEYTKPSFIYKQKFLIDTVDEPSYRLMHRLRINYKNYQFGILNEKDRSERLDDSLLKYSIELKNIFNLDKIILGHFKISQGWGLALDTTDGMETEYKEDSLFSTRQLRRINGLFSDLTTTELFSFHGLALQKKYNNFTIYTYYSSDKKDGILNADGSVNYYYYSNTRDKNYYNNFREDVVGGYLKYQLPIDGLEGSHIAIGGYRMEYDKEFRPDTITLFPNNTMVPDPDYLKLFRGKTRIIQNADFQLIWRRFGLFGEIAHLARGGSAHNLGGRYDSNNGNYLILWRNYNTSYDNPYARGFGEGYGRFDATILSYDYKYRMIDLNGDNITDYYNLSNSQTMKSECGYYLQAQQIRFSRFFRITQMYYDNWDYYRYVSSTNSAPRVNNDRMQGEIEIQPFLNFAFRLKHKLQRKNKNHETKSTTNESTIRFINRLTEVSDLNIEYKYAKNENITGGKTDGNLYSVDFDYKFSSKFSMKTGIGLWKTDGMSMWNIDDDKIDFMDGNGFKYYLAMTNYLSDNLQLKFFFKQKFTDNELSTRYTYKYIDGGQIRILDYADNNTIIKTYINWRF